LADADDMITRHVSELWSPEDSRSFQR
jgi:hypothetical protein